MTTVYWTKLDQMYTLESILIIWFLCITYLLVNSLLSWVVTVYNAVWRCFGSAPSAKAKSCILEAISASPS